jgi:UDP-glucose 4-epimerase
MSGPTVLVTGGGGFIGTWVLRELLHRGARPLALDIQPSTDRWARVLGLQANSIEFSDEPLTDCAALETLIRRRGVSHIIHLAAMLTPDCQRDPYLGCQVNILGSTAVFEAARRAGSVQSIALASSYAVYGETANEGSHPPTFYGAFKQAVDMIAEQYWRHFGLRSLAIRPHVVYGPERETGLTAGPSLACRAAARGERYTIGYVGVAGYDYVEDVARAFVRGTFESPPGANVADLPSEPATTADIVRMIELALPESAGTISVSGPSIPVNISSMPRELRTILPDWRPTRLTDGIAKTIAFYRSTGGAA